MGVLLPNDISEIHVKYVTFILKLFDCTIKCLYN